MAHSPMGSCVEDIIRRADKALYAAKQSGRNRIVVFRPNFEPRLLEGPPP